MYLETLSPTEKKLCHETQDLAVRMSGEVKNAPLIVVFNALVILLSTTIKCMGENDGADTAAMARMAVDRLETEFPAH